MQYNTQTTIPGHVPAKGKRRWILPTALTIGGVLVGAGLASAAQPDPETVTKTIERPVEVEKIVTETETVEVTPQACLDAIESAETLIVGMGALGTVIAEYIELIPAAYEAGYLGYGEGEVMDEMDAINERVTAIDMTDARAELDALTDECNATAGEGA